MFPSGTRGRHDGDDRLDPALAQLEGEDDAVELEQDAGLVDFRRQLIGEMGDQVLGQPGVDLLVGKHGFPVRFVADVVAELKALGDEFLGLTCALLARLEDDVAIIGGLVGQTEPTCRGNRR